MDLLQVSGVRLLIFVSLWSFGLNAGLLGENALNRSLLMVGLLLHGLIGSVIHFTLFS